mmetsp:Transcript_36079/g.90750  ORF Transcript_36079/g.90750 Transcript_36079/m.90750 type:complete len:260 (+) Transcript_36079:786-1565(+)
MLSHRASPGLWGDLMFWADRRGRGRRSDQCLRITVVGDLEGHGGHDRCFWVLHSLCGRLLQLPAGLYDELFLHALEALLGLLQLPFDAGQPEAERPVELLAPALHVLILLHRLLALRERGSREVLRSKIAFSLELLVDCAEILSPTHLLEDALIGSLSLRRDLPCCRSAELGLSEGLPPRHLGPPLPTLGLKLPELGLCRVRVICRCCRQVRGDTSMVVAVHDHLLQLKSTGWAHLVTRNLSGLGVHGLATLSARRRDD